MPSFEERVNKAFPCPPVDIDVHALEETRVPKHVAIIMDGNGRWAKAQGLARLDGHKAGIESVRECIYAANDLGIDYLTIYAFSTENWKRSTDEVSGLMHLFADTLTAELKALNEEGVRLKYLGHMDRLPKKTREVFESGLDSAKDNTCLTLCFAVDYGSRDEITNASRILAEKVKAGKLDPQDITPEMISDNLYTAGIPDPDLVIRTSGEKRLSNFLMWQAAYSEIYVTPVLWPDFDRYDFARALLDYQARQRRFGSA